MKKLKFIFSIIGMICSFAFADFAAWKQDFAKRAKQNGITEHTLQQAFYTIQVHPAIIKSDRNQAEFKKTFGAYIRGALSPSRVKMAKQKYKQYFPILNETYQKYGVHPRYLVAFWGLETNFGGYMGNEPVMRSLVTLAYDKRRRKFFETELMYALQIVQDEHVSPDFKGSWAGAFGNMQFLPSTFVQYAIDGNNDGKIDLFNTPADYFYSAGNFLSKIGWRKKEIWGREVQLPTDVQNFDWNVVGHGVRKSMAEWQEIGLTYAYNKPLHTDYEHQASLLVPQGYTGPKFLVYNNFRRILKWNRSDSYALAVGLLANTVMDYAPMSWIPDPNDKGITTADIEIVQKYLQQQGLYTGKIDRIIGKDTKKAVRIWQSQNGRVGDAYVTDAMVQIMKQGLQ